MIGNAIMKKILLTAFDPFGGDSFNAAQYAVENCKAPEGFELCKMIVPTVFGLAAEKVAEEIERLRPDVIISVGEGSARHMVTPERIGINVMDARIPDNAGYQPVDEKIAAGGPDAYFSILPIKAMVERMKAAGFAAEVSNSAGTFVCNSLMYGVLHYVNTHFYDGAARNYMEDPFSSGPSGNGSGIPDRKTACKSCIDEASVHGSENYRPIAGFIHVPADRPVVNPDGSIVPVPLTSALAISEALKVLE